jgi:tetrahydromethanopterin S-methyltransferase subunit B
MQRLPEKVERFIRKEVLKLKNVNGYSKTLKPRIKAGKVIDSELCIRIYVEKKVPATDLTLAEIIPSEIMGYKTDVVETGPIKALQSDPKKRYRPLVAGISAIHYRGTACTLSLAFKDVETGEVLLAQNNHCSALEGKAKIGDAIIQPSPYDSGKLPDDKVGELFKFVPISFEEYTCPFRRFLMRFVRFFRKAAPNKVDVGFFKPTVEWKQEVLDKGPVRGKCVPEIGDKVWKVGRTTGFTEGTVADLDWAGYVQYGRGTAFFEDCILVEGEGFSQGGDSSSPVQKGDLTVGMLFAGSSSHTIVCKIENIEAIGRVKLICVEHEQYMGASMNKKANDPILSEIVGLRERVAKLEQKSENMEGTLKAVKDRLEKLSDRVWYVLSGVVLSILLQILLRLLH